MKISDILSCLETRTANCLRSLVDNQLSMPISEFVTKYTWKDFLWIKNSGKKSLANLRNVLKEKGYNF